MRPLNYDIRSYKRRFVSSTTVKDGVVQEEYSVDGPYSLAFVPGGKDRSLTEQGYAYDSERYYVIADGCTCFEPGNVLMDGSTPLYVVEEVKTWPTEQTMYVRKV